MTKADDDLLVMKAARMSTASIAQLMGWTEARVYNRLAVLEGQRLAPAPPPPMPVKVVPATRPRPEGSSRPPPPPRPPAGRKPEAVVQIAALTPAKQRYVGWFLAAGWKPDDVAFLFDLA